MNCPNCDSENTDKVIAAALPMKFCHDCKTLWGEPWATIHFYVVAPLEAMFNGGFLFYPYEGNYFKGLWGWLTSTCDD